MFVTRHVSHEHYVSLVLHQPPNCLDVRRTSWANFETCLERLTPFHPELHNEIAINTCVEIFSGAFLKVLPASTNNRQMGEDTGPQIGMEFGTT
jgi:hypothetical protein